MRVLYERKKGSNRINRGGCWYSLARNCLCRAAFRHWDAASGRYFNLGFRPIIRIKGLG